MDFIVGTFNTPELFTFRFTPPSPAGVPASLQLTKTTPALGSHSWLAVSENKQNLYATAWLEPPSVAAYALANGTPKLLNHKPVQARSGYVCVSSSHVYSAGGPSGEAFALAPDGSIGDLVQQLSFVEDEKQQSTGSVPHGDFGGLRHGAHSADLSPDKRSLYIADIGRNCIWTYAIDKTASGPHLSVGSKHISPRPNDGPRHATPHPSGRILYSLQEHTSMVDLFSVAADGTTLAFLDGVKIIPADKDPKNYWADEVRLSTPRDGERVPKYLYASTRGLQADTKGYVAVFALDEQGHLASKEPLDMFETATSGGWANAIEPAPRAQYAGKVEYAALTDSEQGLVFVLVFDGHKISEVARANLGEWNGKTRQAATAVWL